MSTKFFNNIESTLMDKFHGIASAMANFQIFHAVVGYFRSSGYFKLRQELSSTQEIKILVGINIDNIFRKAQAAGKMFFGDNVVSLALVARTDHDRRAVGVVGAHIHAAVAAHLLEPHPEVGLKILD